MTSAILPSYSKPNIPYPSSLLVDYPLLVQGGQVSWQPPVTHVQQRAHPHPAQGLTAAAYSQPTTDIPAITQYSVSTQSLNNIA
jgi:hypothetical protein